MTDTQRVVWFDQKDDPGGGTLRKRRFTSGGVPLTPAVLDQLATEAEAGYTPEQLRPRHP